MRGKVHEDQRLLICVLDRATPIVLPVEDGSFFPVGIGLHFRDVGEFRVKCIEPIV